MELPKIVYIIALIILAAMFLIGINHFLKIW